MKLSIALLCLFMNAFYLYGASKEYIPTALNTLLVKTPRHTEFAKHGLALQYAITGNGMPYGIKILLKQELPTPTDAGLMRLEIDYRDDYLTLSELRINRSLRKKGIGSILFSLARDIADTFKFPMNLEAAPFDTSSDGEDPQASLVRFYVRNGCIIEKESGFSTHMSYTPCQKSDVCDAKEEQKTPVVTPAPALVS